ncbi:hypothetical protein [Parasphingorhabdus halotolerans]|uniref:Lipoprotein n=1 Tax=Parasphingorhabdus halotolerans TaxID=2725558 RepID=A0A6H2DI65_9SPHN|nr:hypothetical protein [Parasphingorhabdus halotolerans]QJB68359.1 hypothetical protein HF685_02775 [Parasphingorhabdus halotolerans]
MNLRYALITMLFLSACSTTKVNYTPVTQQISEPPLNTSTETPIGGAMLKQGALTETKGIALAQKNNINNYTFSKGFYPQIGEDAEYTYHSYQMGLGLSGFGGLMITGGLLGPMQNDVVSLRATKGSNQLCVDRSMGAKACDTEIGYTRTTKPIVSEANFQQTLIYSGRVGDRIKVGYREFSGNNARPAFSNEVDYDLSQSMEIAYKGALIMVEEADNKKIRYTVIKNFNTD